MKNCLGHWGTALVIAACTADRPPSADNSGSAPDANTATVNAPDASAPDASSPGASSPGASTPDASTPGASTPDASTPGASTPDASVLAPAPKKLTALPTPVLEGQFALASFPFPAFPFSGDASVVEVGNALYMYHTCYATDRSGTDTCLATSDDGVHWDLVNTGDPNSLGRVLRSPTDAWDAAHETPFALLREGQTLLYAAGYAPPSAGFLGAASVRLALARSADGVHFGATEGPLFEPVRSGLDDHGLTSPSLLALGDELVLVYTGFCTDAARCARASAGKYTAQLGATSRDGVRWTRRSEPVLVDTGLSWAPDGVAETHVVRDPDSGKYLMFFQALSADAPHVLGVAWADSPFGPYTLHDQPILVPDDVGPWANGGVVAPHALFREDALWLWFSGEERDPATLQTKTFRIGLARAPRPFLGR